MAVSMEMNYKREELLEILDKENKWKLNMYGIMI
jgi:hypothetical protein